ncbi:hypothetical protein ABZX95_17415 [Streptomyces sp. NPDC004232]|uniref:hypothetical protein n=1 Tax=Streptomyces sp. NPDC004232 TaxID=3154454 RepID=UPI0033B928F5
MSQTDPTAVLARIRQMADYWEQQLPEVIRTPAVVSALRAAMEPAAECSAQNHNYESGPRLCIRAAQHRGDHIDKRGFHWSDTVAVYPVADGTFRRGSDVRAELRRLAVEAHDTGTQQQAPDLAERKEQYAVAIHDAMESDLSLVDQEPGYQALIARAAEAAMALADTEAQQQPTTEAEAAATLARECVDRPAVIRWCADRVRSTDGDYAVLAAAEYLDDLATEIDEAEEEPASVAQQPAAEAWDVPDARPGTTDYARQQQAAAADGEETPFVPPMHYRGRDGTTYCVHATPIGPNSCRECRDLADS